MKKLTLIEEEREILIRALNTFITVAMLQEGTKETAKILLLALKKL